MAGSPKKREREKAARLAAAGLNQETAGTAVSVPALAPLQEVLPPEVPDITRTALKRAMRSRAQEHAEKAIAVLAIYLDSPDPRIATAAANDLLAWGFGKPAQEIEAGDGAVVVNLVSFRDLNP